MCQKLLPAAPRALLDISHVASREKPPAPARWVSIPAEPARNPDSNRFSAASADSSGRSRSVSKPPLEPVSHTRVALPTATSKSHGSGRQGQSKAVRHPSRPICHSDGVLGSTRGPPPLPSVETSTVPGRMPLGTLSAKPPSLRDSRGWAMLITLHHPTRPSAQSVANANSRSVCPKFPPIRC